MLFIGIVVSCCEEITVYERVVVGLLKLKSFACRFHSNEEIAKRKLIRHIIGDVGGEPAIHQPLGGAQGQASDIMIAAKEIEKTRTELYNIISEHSGQPFERVFADADRDFWMTAQEALDYGMVDEILKAKEKSK